MHNKKCIYVTINEQTVFLVLISKLLKISCYKMFLLYEVFGNDLFFFFEILKNHSSFEALTQYRIRRYQKQAHSIARAFSLRNFSYLSVTENKTFNLLKDLIIEDKFKFIEDVEA